MFLWSGVVFLTFYNFFDNTLHGEEIYIVPWAVEFWQKLFIQFFMFSFLGSGNKPAKQYNKVTTKYMFGWFAQTFLFYGFMRCFNWQVSPNFLLLGFFCFNVQSIVICFIATMIEIDHHSSLWGTCMYTLHHQNGQSETFRTANFYWCQPNLLIFAPCSKLWAALGTVHKNYAEMWTLCSSLANNTASL